jgi:hypothetical protein
MAFLGISTTVSDKTGGSTSVGSPSLTDSKLGTSSEETSSELDDVNDEEEYLVSEEDETIPINSVSVAKEMSFSIPEGGSHLDARNAQGKSMGSIRPPVTVIATGVVVTAGENMLAEYLYDGKKYYAWLDWWPMYFETEYPAKGK